MYGVYFYISLSEGSVKNVLHVDTFCMKHALLSKQNVLAKTWLYDACVVVLTQLKIWIYYYLTFSDLERVREGLGDKVSFMFQFLSQFLAGFAIGFVKGWKLALVMMSLTPVLAMCGAFLARVRIYRCRYVS